MSTRSFISKLLRGRQKAPTLERAEAAHAQGHAADAAGMIRALAERGDLQAQLRLGQLYERGDGVLQNFVEAERWYRSAAEQGSVAAQAAGQLVERRVNGFRSFDVARGGNGKPVIGEDDVGVELGNGADGQVGVVVLSKIF